MDDFGLEQPPDSAYHALSEQPGLLREAIREILAEVLPGLLSAAPTQHADGAADDPPAGSAYSSPETMLDPHIHPVGTHAVRPAEPRPGQAGPGQAGPGQAGPGQAGPGQAGPGQAGPGQAEPRPGQAGPWVVRLDTDEELHAFVLAVIKLADNPKGRRDLLSGRSRFTLGTTRADPVTGPVHRVDKGAVTERAVVAAAAVGARLVLGRRAVLTPLARDSARALKVPIEKER
jgi:hypothetical protein